MNSLCTCVNINIDANLTNGILKFNWLGYVHGKNNTSLLSIFPPFKSIHFLWQHFFYNAGTTTVTSGPGLCHETALGLAENKSADCLRVWLLPLGSLCAGPDGTENTRDTAQHIRADLSLTLHSVLCFIMGTYYSMIKLCLNWKHFKYNRLKIIIC